MFSCIMCVHLATKHVGINEMLAGRLSDIFLEGLLLMRFSIYFLLSTCMFSCFLLLFQWGMLLLSALPLTLRIKSSRRDFSVARNHNFPIFMKGQLQTITVTSMILIPGKNVISLGLYVWEGAWWKRALGEKGAGVTAHLRKYRNIFIYVL